MCLSSLHFLERALHDPKELHKAVWLFRSVLSQPKVMKIWLTWALKGANKSCKIISEIRTYASIWKKTCSVKHGNIYNLWTGHRYHQGLWHVKCHISQSCVWDIHRRRPHTNASNRDCIHIYNTNLRFNLEKDLQRKAWEYLQSMNRQEFKSYSHVISLALVDYFDRYYIF